MRFGSGPRHTYKAHTDWRTMIVGSGKRLFNGVTTTTLRLVEATTTDTGVIELTYTSTT